MKPEPKVQPEADSRKKGTVGIPNDDSEVDRALDEALQESFPASDPVAITIENRKPVEKTL